MASAIVVFYIMNAHLVRKADVLHFVTFSTLRRVIYASVICAGELLLVFERKKTKAEESSV